MTAASSRIGTGMRVGQLNYRCNSIPSRTADAVSPEVERRDPIARRYDSISLQDQQRVAADNGILRHLPYECLHRARSKRLLQREKWRCTALFLFLRGPAAAIRGEPSSTAMPGGLTVSV